MTAHNILINKIYSNRHIPLTQQRVAVCLLTATLSAISSEISSDISSDKPVINPGLLTPPAVPARTYTAHSSSRR
ncbi:MAG: hypothetical protein RSB25_11580, partial [Acinetobacter sp.]